MVDWFLLCLSIKREATSAAAYINAHHKFIHLPARQLIRKGLGRSKKGAAVRIRFDKVFRHI